MCFWREAEKVHFWLASEHDAPSCSKLKQCKRAEVFPNRGHFCGRRKCRGQQSDTACGVAEQSKAGENVKSSRVVPTEHLCAVKEFIGYIVFDELEIIYYEIFFRH